MPSFRGPAVLLASASCLLVAAAGPADAAKKKCAKTKEKAGCKLPKGASYEATLEGGGGAIVDVDRKGWSVSISAIDRPRGSGACDPRFANTGLDFKGRPKVGRSYTLEQDVRRPDSGVDNAIKVTGKVTFTSAKKVTFTGTFSSQRTFRDNVYPLCERSLAATGTREK